MNNNKKLRAIIERQPLLRKALWPAVLIRRKVLGHRNRKIEQRYDELFNNVRGGRIVIEIENFPGVFEFDIFSDILKTALITKRFESEQSSIALRYAGPECDIVDVGANVGLYSVLFSRAVQDRGRVLAIEPAPNAIDCLRKNLQRNGCMANTIVFEGVVAERKGKYLLNVIPGKEEYSSLGKIDQWVLARGPVTLEVEGESIDNLVVQFGLRPGLIKIDAEGAEQLIIQGAADTINRYHPVILMELSANLLASLSSQPSLILALLEKLRYRFYDARTLVEIHGVPPSGNMLALPQQIAR